jgi:hypothetical protein
MSTPFTVTLFPLRISARRLNIHATLRIHYSEWYEWHCLKSNYQKHYFLNLNR